MNTWIYRLLKASFLSIVLTLAPAHGAIIDPVTLRIWLATSPYLETAQPWGKYFLDNYLGDVSQAHQRVINNNLYSSFSRPCTRNNFQAALARIRDELAFISKRYSALKPLKDKWSAMFIFRSIFTIGRVLVEQGIVEPDSTLRRYVNADKEAQSLLEKIGLCTCKLLCEIDEELLPFDVKGNFCQAHLRSVDSLLAQLEPASRS